MEKIKLEEILLSNSSIDRNVINSDDFNDILNSMKIACEKVLVLAAENGEVVFVSETLGKISLSSSEKKKFVLNKDSILNTIDQVEL